MQYLSSSSKEKDLATVVTDVTASLKISEDALIRANKKPSFLHQITKHDINNDLPLAYASIDLIQAKFRNPATDDTLVTCEVRSMPSIPRLIYPEL